MENNGRQVDSPRALSLAALTIGRLTSAYGAKVQVRTESDSHKGYFHLSNSSRPSSRLTDQFPTGETAAFPRSTAKPWRCRRYPRRWRCFHVSLSATVARGWCYSHVGGGGGGFLYVCMCSFCCRVQSCSKRPSAEFTIHLSPLTCTCAPTHSPALAAPSAPLVFILSAICIKTHHLFAWCHLDVAAMHSVIAAQQVSLTKIQKCTHTYFTTGVKKSRGEGNAGKQAHKSTHCCMWWIGVCWIIYIHKHTV